MNEVYSAYEASIECLIEYYKNSLMFNKSKIITFIYI